MIARIARRWACIWLFLACALALAILFGGPRRPAPLTSIVDPFKAIDYSDLPAMKHFSARDGTQLAYREYAPPGAVPARSVILVHGSSADSRSMHLIARAYAAAGYASFALDMRGHGASGNKGTIAYIGQLEDDLADFVAAVRPEQPATLLGFSSGGGFVLRFAASERQKLFANYLLLSPFISQDAPTYKPDSGGWVSVGLPRTIALAILNTMGISRFNDLAIINFALPPDDGKRLTDHYSYALAMNFRPHREYQADIRSARQPMELIAGDSDELFHADRYTTVFSTAGRAIPVTLLPNAGHVALIRDPVAMQATIVATGRMVRRGNAADKPG